MLGCRFISLWWLMLHSNEIQWNSNLVKFSNEFGKDGTYFYSIPSCLRYETSKCADGLGRNDLFWTSVFVFQLINQKIQMCMQLLSSRSFVSVLEYLLAIGNYLNENAGKGKAKGFRLSSLTKVGSSAVIWPLMEGVAAGLIRCLIDIHNGTSLPPPFHFVSIHP